MNYLLTSVSNIRKKQKKVFLVMRLSFIILSICLFQLSASVYSQNGLFTIETKKTTMRELFHEIEQQSKFRFFYNDVLTNIDKEISIDVKEKEINEVLDLALSNSGITYRILDNQLIVVSPVALLQQITVTGTVTDNAGDPLPGVNVVIKGTTTGVVSDFNGRYSIGVLNADATLQFSFVGYVTAEFIVGSQRMINVTLLEDASLIEEVVVVGYGTQKKANLTGAVDVISEKQLINRSAPTVAQLIQGVAPNVDIGMTQDGGEPGATRRWNIRGTGRITATMGEMGSRNDGPLILVDGVETSTDHIDPESIESISILKDASSSAIYGSRAPFGVVLITTKKGKNQAARVSYSNNFAFHKPLNIPHFVDALTFVNVFDQVMVENTSLAPIFPDAQVQRVKDYMSGAYPYEYWADGPGPPTDLANQNRPRWNGNANNDWPNMYFNRKDPTQKHNINVEGGNEKMNFYISAGLSDQPGLHTWGNDYYKRYNVLGNVSASVADWIRLNLGVKYAKDETNRPLGMQGESRYYISRQMYWGPILPKYNLDGTYMNMVIQALENNGREIITGNNLALNLGGEIEPVKGWKTNITYHYQYAGSTNYQNPKPTYFSVGHWEHAIVGNAGVAPDVAGSREELATSDRILINAVSSYERLFGKHYFKLLGGYEQELYRNASIIGTARGAISLNVPAINTSVGTKEVSAARGHWANQGYFGRLEYNFSEKYLLEFNGRFSGSSRFEDGKRWGFFPSAAAGYVISKEEFFAPIQQYVNFLKFRVSYGSVGNSNVPNYLYLPNLNIRAQNYYLMNNQRPNWVDGPPGIVSDALTWEKIRTLNLGADAAFLNNRLSATFEWYNRTTVDMVGPGMDLPAVLGTTPPRKNNSELETKGFELIVNWRDRISNDLSYNVGFTLGNYKTKITKYEDDSGNIDNWYTGMNLGEVWGYDVVKIMNTPEDLAAMPNQDYLGTAWKAGDFMFKDHVGDGVIDEGTRTLDNHGAIRIIGNTTPRYNFSITAGATYKGFDFNMLWQGIVGQDFFPNNTNIFYFGWIGGSQGNDCAIFKDSPALDYWRSETSDPKYGLGPNTDSFFPRFYANDAQHRKNMPRANRGMSRFKLNAGYMRLKNLQIGYTVPADLSRKVWVQRARIYVSGENLLTFTSLPKTMEPETIVAANGGSTMVGASYPITRALSFGLNLTF